MHKLTVIPLLLVLSSPLAATVISSPGLNVVGYIAPPDVNCVNVIDSTCAIHATGSATVLGTTFDVDVRSTAVGNDDQPFYDDETDAAGQFVSVRNPDGFDDPVSLAPGTEIGPSSHIVSTLGLPLAVNYSDPSVDYNQDFIQNDTGNDILGVAFSQSDGTHYGWINFQWQPLISPYNKFDEYGLSVAIGGYAYESCPNQPIAAGATSGGASCTPTPESSSLLLFILGLLAFAPLFLAASSTRTGAELLRSARKAVS